MSQPPACKHVRRCSVIACCSPSPGPKVPWPRIVQQGSVPARRKVWRSQVENNTRAPRGPVSWALRGAAASRQRLRRPFQSAAASVICFGRASSTSPGVLATRGWPDGAGYVCHGVQNKNPRQWCGAALPQARCCRVPRVERQDEGPAPSSSGPPIQSDRFALDARPRAAGPSGAIRGQKIAPSTPGTP